MRLNVSAVIEVMIRLAPGGSKQGGSKQTVATMMAMSVRSMAHFVDDACGLDSSVPVSETDPLLVPLLAFTLLRFLLRRI